MDKLPKAAMRTAAALCMLSSLVACASSAPIALSSQFTPPDRMLRPSDTRAGMRSTAHGAAPCTIRLGEIRDERSTPETMGTMLGRVIHAADTVAWVRSGLQSLSRDSRITFAEAAAGGQPGLVLNVELLKAYVMSVTGETRTASVVLRVHYSRDRAILDTEVYRGTENGINWTDGQEETQSSFDNALAQILTSIDRDILDRCSFVPPAGAASNAPM